MVKDEDQQHIGETSNVGIRSSGIHFGIFWKKS